MNSLLFPWEEEKFPPPSSLVVTFFIWLGVGFLLDYCISKIKNKIKTSQRITNQHKSRGKNTLLQVQEQDASTRRTDTLRLQQPQQRQVV